MDTGAKSLQTVEQHEVGLPKRAIWWTVVEINHQKLLEGQSVICFKENSYLKKMAQLLLKKWKVKKKTTFFSDKVIRQKNQEFGNTFWKDFSSVHQIQKWLE